MMDIFFFFFNDTATTEIYTLSLHDALPIFPSSDTMPPTSGAVKHSSVTDCFCARRDTAAHDSRRVSLKLNSWRRSEEHTSELQSRQYLVCRLLLEKKKKLMSH